MVHRLCERNSQGSLVVRLGGPSVPWGGSRVESSWVGRSDVLVLSGSPAALEAVQVAFAACPGEFAGRVVRSIRSVLASAGSQGVLPGV